MSSHSSTTSTKADSFRRVVGSSVGDDRGRVGHAVGDDPVEGARPNGHLRPRQASRGERNREQPPVDRPDVGGLVHDRHLQVAVAGALREEGGGRQEGEAEHQESAL